MSTRMKKIKALTPKGEAEKKEIDIDLELLVIINGKEFSWDYRNQYTNYYGALVDIREGIEKMYAFLNENLGTHYIVKNDTESNLKDLGIT